MQIVTFSLFDFILDLSQLVVVVVRVAGVDGKVLLAASQPWEPNFGHLSLDLPQEDLVFNGRGGGGESETRSCSRRLVEAHELVEVRAQPLDILVVAAAAEVRLLLVWVATGKPLLRLYFAQYVIWNRKVATYCIVDTAVLGHLTLTLGAKNILVNVTSGHPL